MADTLLPIQYCAEVWRNAASVKPRQYILPSGASIAHRRSSIAPRASGQSPTDMGRPSWWHCEWIDLAPTAADHLSESIH